VEKIISNFISGFDVVKSVHHHTMQINQPTRCNNFTSFLLDVYLRLNMFRAPQRPSSADYNCISSLWFYRWSAGGSSALGRGLAGYNRLL